MMTRLEPPGIDPKLYQLHVCMDPDEEAPPLAKLYVAQEPGGGRVLGSASDEIGAMRYMAAHAKARGRSKIEVVRVFHPDPATMPQNN